jgi:MFS family permease
MLFKKDELRHLGLFYLATLLQAATAVIMPFIIIFFRDQSLSFTQIGVMIAGYAVFSFVFEVPTGAFADAYSRKRSVIFATFVTACIVALFVFASSFWEFFMLWSLLGIALTFETGAYSAWVIGNLNKLKRKDLHQEYFIKEHSLTALGFVLSPLLGSFLIQRFSYDGLWLFFSAGGFLMVILLFFIPEHYKPKKVSIRKAVSKNVSLAKKGFKIVLKKKQLFYFILASMFVIFIGLGDDGWQPFFVELGAPVHYLGYFYSIMAFFLIGIPFLTKLFTKYKIKYVLSLSYVFSALLLLSVLLLQPGMFWYALIPFVLLSGVDVFVGPLGETYFHKHISESVRATVVSIRSMASTLAGGVVVLVAGVLLDIFPIPLVMALGAVFVIGAVYCYSKL